MREIKMIQIALYVQMMLILMLCYLLLSISKKKPSTIPTINRISSLKMHKHPPHSMCSGVPKPDAGAKYFRSTTYSIPLYIHYTYKYISPPVFVRTMTKNKQRVCPE